MTKTVSMYLRVSTCSQSTDSQRMEVETFCGRQGWKIVNVYQDVASGKNADREALNQMLKDVRAGKAGEAIVVYKLDRLGRSTQDLLRILSDLQAAGVAFVSTTQQIDTSHAMGRMLVTFLSAICEYERETIIERVKSGLERAKADGVKLGRPRVGFDVAAALDMKRDGKSWSELAKALGASVATIRRTVTPLLKNPLAHAA